MLGVGVGEGLDWKAIFGYFTHARRLNLGGRGVCAGEALGYITDAASLGAFSYS